MNAREKAIAFRLLQLAAILALLIGGIASLANQAGQTTMLGMSSKLFFGIIGAATAIYVALAFSKFMFKNLPSAYQESKQEPEGASVKALSKYQEVKYSNGKRRKTSDFEKYYSLPKASQKRN